MPYTSERRERRYSILFCIYGIILPTPPQWEDSKGNRSKICGSELSDKNFANAFFSPFGTQFFYRRKQINHPFLIQIISLNYVVNP